MSEDMSFKYFYGTEADQFTFYRIPKLLITDDYFKEVSSDAKILYGLMLDRMSLSIKNSWLDEQKRVFIYFSMEDTMEYLNVGKNKALKTLAELDTGTGIGLIERVKQGQGKAARIYVKKFMRPEVESDPEVYNVNVKTSQYQTSRVPQSKHAEVYDVIPNKNNNNKTERNNNESDLIISAENRCDEIGYADLIKQNLEWDLLNKRYPYEGELLNGIFDIILETVLSQNDSIVVAGDRYPISIVKSKLLKLQMPHIEYVIDCLKHNTTKIHNIKKYLLAALFNAPSTISGYYQAEVNHDMPQLVL